MLIAILFGAIVGNLFNAQLSYEECKLDAFKHKSCAIQKAAHDLNDIAK